MVEPFSFHHMKRILDNVVRTCRFYTPMRLPRIDISITIGSAPLLWYLRERIEDRVTTMLNNLLGRDFFRLTLYFNEYEYLDDREYLIEDYCVYIGIEGLLPLL